MAAINFVCQFICVSVICSAQNSNIDMKIKRLNRLTNVLLKDVEDIWAVLSTQEHSNIETHTDVIHQVKETVSDVKELKTQVQQLVIYAKTGLKNEKKSHQEIRRNLTRSHTEFLANTESKIVEMQKHIYNLEDKQTDLQESSRICQLRIENITHDYTKKFNECKVTAEEAQANSQQKNNFFERKGSEIMDKLDQLEQQITAVANSVIACDDQWKNFKNHCYCFFSSSQTWDQASASCQSHNSYLVELTTDEEVEFVGKLAGGSTVWVGARDKVNEGTFIWQRSKQEVAKIYWNKGEPNDAGKNEDCATMYSYRGVRYGKFNDVGCGSQRSFVCEKPLQTAS